MSATTIPSLIDWDKSDPASVKMVVRFHPGQMRVMQSTARIILLLAGSQSGKTVAGPHWLLREMQQRGPGDYIMAAPVFPLMDQKARPEFLRLFRDTLHYGKITGKTPHFELNKYGESCLWPQLKTEVSTNVFFGYATNAESLEATTAKAAWLDEAGQTKFKLESWEAIKRRLTVNRGRTLLTTTPYNLGWLKQQIWDKCTKIHRTWHGKNTLETRTSEDGTMEVIQFESTMNPAFSEEEFESQRRSMPPWRFDLFHRAVFTRPAGAIYDCWDDAKHKVLPFTIPSNWPRFLGLDFGGVHTAGVFLAGELDQDGNETGRYFAYKEYPERRQWGLCTAREHKEKMLKNEPMIPRAVGGAASEDNWRIEFRSAGLPVREPPIKEVEVGIDRVRQIINDGRLFVFDTCAGLLDDIVSYSRELDENGEPTEKIAEKERYHFCFVAGTKVATARGQIPIEQVTTDDLVWTRKGLRPVECSGSVGVRDIYKVCFSDGRELAGTADHPVWVEDKGFVRLDALQYNDVVLSFNSLPEILLCGVTKQVNYRRLQSTVLYGEDTRIRLIQLIGIFAALNTAVCIGMYGRSIKGKFQKDTISIIKMVIGGTINSAILKCFLMEIICDYITVVNVRMLIESIWLKYVYLQRYGMVRKRDWNGTDNMEEMFLAICNLRHLFANNVAISLSQRNMATKLYSVPERVRLGLGSYLELMLKRLNVDTVVRYLRLVNMQTESTVPVIVQTSQKSRERQQVYNLTVTDQHEYFANGVLVSNCDCLRYLCCDLMQPKKKVWIR